MGDSSNPVQKLLSVGAIAVLQVERFGVSGGRYRTTIRGWVEDEYVIVDAPKGEGPSVRLQTREACNVCFLARGEACGFECMVMESSAKTAPFLHLSWPEALKVTRVRQHERIEIALVCSISTSDDERLQGEILDLSAGGCRIITRIPIEAGMTVGLTFSLPDGTRVDGLPAIIRNVTACREGFMCGCQFVETPSTGLKDIEFFVSSRLSHSRGEHPKSHVVLVIGDESPTVTQMCEQLERFSINTFSSSSTVDAFYRLKMSRPGAVLVDFNQADCTCADICRWIRSADGFQCVPVIVFGGESSETVEKEVIAAGATQYYDQSVQARTPVRAVILSLDAKS